MQLCNIHLEIMRVLISYILSAYSLGYLDFSWRYCEYSKFSNFERPSIRGKWLFFDEKINPLFLQEMYEDAFI